MLDGFKRTLNASLELGAQVGRHHSFPPPSSPPSHVLSPALLKGSAAWALGSETVLLQTMTWLAYLGWSACMCSQIAICNRKFGDRTSNDAAQHSLVGPKTGWECEPQESMTAWTHVSLNDCLCASGACQWFWCAMVCARPKLFNTPVHGTSNKPNLCIWGLVQEDLMHHVGVCSCASMADRRSSLALTPLSYVMD